LLRDHAAERKANDIELCQVDRTTEFDGAFVNAATVDGISPDELPMPG
jgi:hypothetical protein